MLARLTNRISPKIHVKPKQIIFGRTQKRHMILVGNVVEIWIAIHNDQSNPRLRGIIYNTTSKWVTKLSIRT